MLYAYERLNPIGHFTVAASFGNVHGVYKPGNVQLRPEILRNSQALIESRMAPLRIRWISSSTVGRAQKAKIAEAVDYGVFKITSTPTLNLPSRRL